MNPYQELAIQALEKLGRNYLDRIDYARRAPRSLLLENKTRRQILQEYQANHDKVNKAIEWVKGLQ